jgi:CheY-like chemotaxis protein
MMPEMDGWEMLQRLRTHADSRVRTLPTVICSVIHDPDLAYSLGASAFVAKPVNKDKLLAALHEVGV